MYGVLQYYSKLQIVYKTNDSNVKAIPFTHARTCLDDTSARICKDQLSTIRHRSYHEM